MFGIILTGYLNFTTNQERIPYFLALFKSYLLGVSLTAIILYIMVDQKSIALQTKKEL